MAHVSQASDPMAKVHAGSSSSSSGSARLARLDGQSHVDHSVNLSSDQKVKNPLFMGIDMSTQQLKLVVIDENLDVLGHVAVEFDTLQAYNTVKGVYVNEKTNEVLAPVAAWLEALDIALDRLHSKMGADLGRIVGISGACQQHATVYWNSQAEQYLAELNGSGSLNKSLASALQPALSVPLSHNWQDASTGAQCALFEEIVGGPDRLAQITGSRAHRRFSGPQILKLLQVDEPTYSRTHRIALASNFMASVLCGSLVPFDKSDVCGMNLWDIEKNDFNNEILGLFGNIHEMRSKLGPVQQIDDNSRLSNISTYFVEKYGFSPSCGVYSFTGDNPSTILALPLGKNDVVVSLGTSTTALVVTENYVPSPEYHLFSHPLEANLSRYMGMLCYCNGALAREKIRDSLKIDGHAHDQGHCTEGDPWTTFNAALLRHEYEPGSVGFYFPLSEIVPECDPIIQRYSGNPPMPTDWPAIKDPRRIVESQMLSVRHRLSPLLTTPTHTARRVFFVGGGSKNPAICSVMANVLAPEEAYRLNLSDACAAGAANMAAYCYYLESDESKHDKLSWAQYIDTKWQIDRQMPIEFDKPYPQGAVDNFVACEKILLS